MLLKLRKYYKLLRLYLYLKGQFAGPDQYVTFEFGFDVTVVNLYHLDKPQLEITYNPKVQEYCFRQQYHNLGYSRSSLCTELQLKDELSYWISKLPEEIQLAVV